MHTTHSRFLLAGLPVQRLDFIPHSFTPADMQALPHAALLARAVASRQAEHLAGRLAAGLALREAGAEHGVPGIGTHREPLWPSGFIGSITHAGCTALAVAVRQTDALHALGIDCETPLDEPTAREIADETVNAAERRALAASGLPFPLALTLAFSAKESLFKALFPRVGEGFGFEAAQVTALDSRHITLRLAARLGPYPAAMTFTAHTLCESGRVVTLIRA
ncbi:enterobactin synthase subunit EntD [Enterobacteriaceae bacterium]